MLRSIVKDIELIELSAIESEYTIGGKEFKGSWWCMFCWIDHFYS